MEEGGKREGKGWVLEGRDARGEEGEVGGKKAEVEA